MLYEITRRLFSGAVLPSFLRRPPSPVLFLPPAWPLYVPCLTLARS